MSANAVLRAPSTRWPRVLIVQNVELYRIFCATCTNALSHTFFSLVCATRKPRLARTPSSRRNTCYLCISCFWCCKFVCLFIFLHISRFVYCLFSGPHPPGLCASCPTHWLQPRIIGGCIFGIKIKVKVKTLIVWPIPPLRPKSPQPFGQGLYIREKRKRLKVLGKGKG